MLSERDNWTEVYYYQLRTGLLQAVISRGARYAIFIPETHACKIYDNLGCTMHDTMICDNSVCMIQDNHHNLYISSLAPIVPAPYDYLLYSCKFLQIKNQFWSFLGAHDQSISVNLHVPLLN